MSPDPTASITFGSLTLSRTQVIRQAYRVMLIVFGLFVLGSFFPVKLESPEWGFQLSNTILNVSILPWLGIVLARLGVILEQREQLDGQFAPGYAAAHADNLDGQEVNDPLPLREDGDLRFMAHMGFALLVLLAVWQMVLFGTSLKALDGRQAIQGAQINQRFDQIEQRIQSLPSPTQALALQQLGVEPSENDLKDPVKALNKRRAEVHLDSIRQLNDFRFVLTREALRNCLLATVYAAGFYGLARF
jgi:hypothetical protein